MFHANNQKTLLVCKQESGGRTHSTVTLLDKTDREQELTRMVGLSV